MKLIDKLKKYLKLRKETKEKISQQGQSKFINSVKHACNGINYTIEHEKNFRIELFFAILVCIASIIFGVSMVEWLILILTIGMVLVLEIINTAIERCVDLVTKEYRELAKIAKDTAAGAVFIMSGFSVCIGICIFLPKIIQFIIKIVG